MDSANRKYLIIPTSVTSSINFSEVEETSINTLRISNDGVYTFVKYNDSSRPSIYSSEYTELNYAEMINYLTGSNWISTDE